MAGYICKIVIENTHPPVWRRVIIPDRITFAELHETIQILFSWGNDHFHEFEVPGDRIFINDRVYELVEKLAKCHTNDTTIERYRKIRKSIS